MSLALDMGVVRDGVRKRESAETVEVKMSWPSV